MHVEPSTTDLPLSPSWRETLSAVLAEGGGALLLALIASDSLDPLLADICTGDREALRLGRILARLSQVLDAHQVPSDTAPLCLCCPQRFTGHDYPRLVTVLSADCAEPNAALVAGVCVRCFVAQDSKAALHAVVLKGLSARFGLELRQVPLLTAVVGHA
jgi:hypothetical protein